MLFLASRILKQELDDEGRLRLLEKLEARKFIPLIRSMRLSCYAQALADSNQVGEMERLIAGLSSSEEQTPYVQGDVFCFDDHTFFLLFGEVEGGQGMRAGIVYESRTAEPLRKLNAFCQTVSLCLAGADEESGEGAERVQDNGTKLTAWRQDPSAIHQGFMRFAAKQDTDSLSVIACRENGRDRVRASKLMDDDYTRLFLRRAREAYAEGYHITPSSDAMAALPEFAVNRLIEAGLLQREVLVSCRKTGHTLLGLPSADALAVVTISNASCSECGAKIANESIEEVFAPTQLVSLLLEDGAWLVNRLHSILRELGIPESDIVVEPPAGDGEARMIARVCDEPFLVVLRDGDLTPAFARRAINTKIETEVRHLMTVVTGAVHNEGRMSLLNFAKRLERSGDDFELIIAEGINAAEAEIKRAFERVSQRALAKHLCELDASVGLSVARLISARFRMLHSSEAAEINSALLPASREPNQSLQNMAQAVALIDFDLLEIKDGDESIASTTLPHPG
ncbi:MAG TPA: hypothetical protein VF735_02655 [Pyrinomonadaceae bacterium]|jgi:hypothetical protein